MSDGGTEPAASGGRAGPSISRPHLHQPDRSDDDFQASDGGRASPRAPPLNPRADQGSRGDFRDPQELEFTDGGDMAASVTGPQFPPIGGNGGDYSDDTTSINRSRSFSPMGRGSGPQQVQDVHDHIHIWKNGFTIGDNGPLIDKEDAQYADMAKRISKGKAQGTIVTHGEDYRDVIPLSGHSSMVVQPTQDLNSANRNLPERRFTLSYPTQEANTNSSLQEIGLPMQEANSFTRSIKERSFIILLGKKEWDAAESFVCNILGGAEHRRDHPVIFLQLRRRALLDLIDEENWTGALDYFENSINLPYTQIVPSLAAQRNKDTDHVIALVRELGRCVQNHQRDNNDSNARLDDDQKLTNFIFDYIRLHLPDKIKFKIKKGFGRFGVEIPKKYPESHKKSYRCLACSEHEMHSESIGRFYLHLKRCRMIVTSPFLVELLDSTVKEVNAGSKKPEVAADSNTSRLQALSGPTRDDYHEMFLNYFAKAKADLVIARRSISDANRSALDPLDESFDKMEFYAAKAWSLSGPASAAPPGPDSLARAKTPKKAVPRPDQTSPASATPSDSFKLPSILARSRRPVQSGSSATEEPSISLSSALSNLRAKVQPMQQEPSSADPALPQP